MSHSDQQTAALSSQAAAIVDAPSSDRWACDPLEPDRPDDEIVVTSSRRLLRVAIAAADAGARFGLEASGHDAAAWMLTPRSVFGGRPAIEACQDREGFMRSVVLHGLRLGLDAEPAEIDGLMAEDAPDPACGEVGCEGVEVADVDPTEVRLPGPLLLTSWIDCGSGAKRVFAFCGMVTDRPVDLVDRIVGRYGARAAASADFQVGFDPTTSMATAMISEAMAQALMVAAEYPTSPLARGLDVSVEQRFAA